MKIVIIFIFVLFSLPGYSIDIPLTRIDGKTHNLSDFKGNWIVVNFWATWCPPCISEMPDLQLLHDKYHDKGVTVIGVNVENLSRIELQTFLDTYFISYPIYQGVQLLNSELGTVIGLPTTFLVSPQGIVEVQKVGRVSSEMIEMWIKDRKFELG